MTVNQPIKFDKSYIDSIRINTSAIQQRVQRLKTSRTFKVEAQVASYLRITSYLDLTTLAGDDTSRRVHRLCAKALQPVSRETLEKLGLADLSLTVGAVCVYHNLVEGAARNLKGRIPVAAVSTGFPAGQIPLDLKAEEIRRSIAAGATEIDVVISRGTALAEAILCDEWRELYREIKLFREVCGDRAKLKTILGVGDLGTLDNVAKAGAVAIMAGSDFIKTSTGKETINATLEAGLVMIRQIRHFRDVKAGLVGFKPAGGISAAKDAMNWEILMKEELGNEWLKPELFRIGASKLLTDIERQLWHLATGHYSANHRHPMG
ncbi:MAG: deoxyribose-phosphate aldolase [bacterium]|nr:deoxyribose-phosphate aldolase [bacterium]